MNPQSLSMGRVIEQTIDLVSDHFSKFFVVALIGALPNLAFAIPEPDVSDATSFADLMPTFGYAALMLVAGFIGFFLWMFVATMLLFSANDAADGRVPDTRSAFERTRGVFLRVLGGSILAALIMGGAMFAAFMPAGFAAALAAVPGMQVVGLVVAGVVLLAVLTVLFALVVAPLTIALPPLLVFERHAVTSSIERAFGLARGRRIRLALIALLALGALSIPGLAWSIGVDLYVTTFDPGFALRLVFAIVGVLIAAAVAPIYAAAVVFTYRGLAPRPAPLPSEA